MYENSYEMFIKSGYVSIGMDHFSKPGDEFEIALKNKQLHRNFQGYCTRETTGQVYAFGASSIYHNLTPHTVKILKMLQNILLR